MKRHSVGAAAVWVALVLCSVANLWGQTETNAVERVIRFGEGGWDRTAWTPVRQPNQQEPRVFTQHADGVGVTMESYKPNDYGKEKDNAILVYDTGMTEGQIEVTFKGGEGFNKTSCPGIALFPVIEDGVATRLIGVFAAEWGFAAWLYSPGEGTRPLKYTAVGRLCRVFDWNEKHVLRCRYSAKRKAIALQIDDSDVLVVSYLGHPTGAFDIEVNSLVGIWGCHGVCDFYEMKVLSEPTLPFDRPLEQ